MENAERMYRRAAALARTYSERTAVRIVALLEEAAEFEHPGALFDLGTWRHYGIVAERDDGAAARLWARAAELGNNEARVSLAIACERGIGVDRDLERAFALYVAAATAGDVNALYEVGRCRYYGIGTSLDRAAAAEAFEHARRFGQLEASADDANGEPPRRMPRPNFAGPFHATRGG